MECLLPELGFHVRINLSSFTISKYELSKRKLKYVPRLPSLRAMRNSKLSKYEMPSRQIQFIKQLLTK